MKNLSTYVISCFIISISTYTSVVLSWNNDYDNDYTRSETYRYQNYHLNRNYNYDNYNRKTKCNCKLLKHCDTMLDILYNAEKPLSTKFIETIRKTNCGYDGNEPLVCCPDYRNRRASYDSEQENAWVWDVEDTTTESPSNPLENRNSYYDNNYNYNKPNKHSHEYETHHNNNNNNNNRHNNRYNNNYNHHHKKPNYFFDFEDPKTNKNCPPSFSVEFEVSHEIKNIKPIKSRNTIVNPEINEIGSVDIATDPISPAVNPPEMITEIPTITQPSDIVTPPTATEAAVQPTVPAAGGTPIDKKTLINTSLCGLSVNTRIIGGEDAGPAQFPWMARIAYRNKSSDRVSYRCAGSVISDRYVVTAAHCVTNLIDDLEVVLVRLGELDTRTNLCVDGQAECSEPQDFTIDSIIYHQNYDQPKYSNDIALIRLKTTSNSSFISPLCLPIDQYAPLDQNSIGSNGIIAGWGAMNPGSTAASPVLQWLRLPIVDTAGCASSYARFSANSRTPIIVGNGQMCAQGRENADACQGDSGGPLMSEGAPGIERYTLIGLVSFGPRTCGVSNFPGVYTRLSSYMNWIIDNMTL